MKMFIISIVSLLLLITNLLSSAIVIDHNCIDLNDIPDRWIDSAKANLHIGYGHTSHGSQLTSGMNALEQYYTSGKYDWSHSGGSGELHLFEGDGYGDGYLDHDCGYVGWDDETREYLDDHPSCNVIIWSWCGQVNDVNLQTHYFEPMEDLEDDYPNVKFVYMTGHLEGLGLDGSLYQANQQIRNYCNNNNKILFDFADIEKYTPDCDTNFQQYNATDACNYNHPEGGQRNWANNWLGNNPGHLLTQISQYCSSCAHSVSLNCTKKGIACWYLWARLAGWGQAPPERTITTGTINGSPFCAGSITDIPFTITGTFNIGNKFIAQLSDENGSFSNPVVLDSIEGTSSGTIEDVKLPESLNSGTAYRIRVVSTNPVVTGSENSSDITINALPDPDINGSISVCAGSEEIYHCNYTSGYIYKWEVSEGTIEGSSTDTICFVKWNTSSTGHVKLKQTIIATGCKDSVIMPILINPLPVPSIDGNEQVCAYSDEWYSAVNSSGRQSKWMVEGGNIIGSSNLSTVNIQWLETGNGKVILEQTYTETGCKNKDSILITINPKPNPEIFGTNSVCGKSRGLYTCKYNEGNSYNWTTEGGEILGSDSDTLVIVEWEDEGEGELKLVETINATGCSDSVFHSVTINPKPQPQISGPEFVIHDSTEKYETEAEEGIDIQWKVTGGNIIGYSTWDSVKVKWSDEESGLLTLVQTNNETGCTDSVTILIIITDKQFPYISGDTETCENEEKKYVTDDNSLIQKQWLVEGGSISAGKESNFIDVLWEEPGTGMVKVIFSIDEKNYMDSLEKQVQIYPIPEVFFTCDKDKICLDEEEFEITGGSPAGGNYSGEYVYDNIFLPADAGIGEHSVTYTYEEHGCKNFAVDTIKIYPLPEKPELVHSLIMGYPSILIKNYYSNHFYKWYVDDVYIENMDNENEIFCTLNGNYKVIVIDDHGCKNTSESILVDVRDNDSHNCKLSIIPNPLSGKIKISFELHENGNVNLSIINSLGYNVSQPISNRFMKSGKYEIEFDAGNIPVGIYFCRMDIGNAVVSEKMIVIK
jgi:hypothetical protein